MPTDDEAAFRQTGWAGLRARLFHLYFVLRRPMT
ncbi:DNA mismatch repair protein MutT, partial [Mesorhizobium sp. M8A.F.Ca.ET.023.01.1.1]